MSGKVSSKKDISNIIDNFVMNVATVEMKGLNIVTNELIDKDCANQFLFYFDENESKVVHSLIDFFATPKRSEKVDSGMFSIYLDNMTIYSLVLMTISCLQDIWYKNN